MTSSQDKCYVALLGLAEYYRTSNPPDIKKAIQCLLALLEVYPSGCKPLRMELRTHLQIGQMLMQYTKSLDLAKTHLEKAVSIFIDKQPRWRRQFITPLVPFVCSGNWLKL